MKCPKCKHENPNGAKFCNECAQELKPFPDLSPQVLSIEEKIDKIQRYLPEGLTEKVLAQRGKIEGERKQVTVMFCDIEGFTPLVEKIGPEKAYSIMDEIYEILIHKVHDFEGTINEMTGDGIMALFGAPIALEDAPQRALRSALAVHNAIAKFNGQRQGIDPIKMRIGVHTGPVVVGTLGNNLRVEFKAVGDTVNLASRMEGLAEPATTYLTEDTFKLAEGLFRFESLGERAIKGKESAVPVYKLMSAKKDVHRPRLGLERNIYSEMVGRDKELDRLELQVLKVVNGEGSIVNIIGEAGIGKSRLVAELKNREMMNRVSLFEGRGVSTGRNLSFHPIIDLLKQWAHIGEDDSGAAALAKFEIAVRQVCREEMDEVLPFVATLMGLRLSGRYAERVKGIEGEALEKLILKNMRDLIIKATEIKPYLIIMEDLQWADTSSIELMESLFRLAETQRIIFINVFRPGYEETGNRIVKALKEKSPDYYIEIDLQPLDERMSETLIDNMLQVKGLKHAVIDQIVGRADGNPFFIEEVVRSFIDHGAVVAKGGVFEVTDRIDTIVIPNTINDVLMARIDRLEEKTRDLLKIASVIGRSFFYRILKEMTKTIGDIDNRLSYLQEIQLFRERNRMGEVEYLFKHALAQKAAYESILLQTRKELHLKVAESIEKVFNERLHEFYGMLAYHYSKGENLDKTEEYMIKAGESALGSSASNEALRYFQEAFGLYTKKYGDKADPEKLSMLEKNIAIAFYNKGEMADAVIYFDRVSKRLGIKSPQNKIAVILKLYSNLFRVILHLYFPLIRSTKVPDTGENEIFDLSYKKNASLALIYPVRAFAEYLWTINKMLGFDLRKVRNWFRAYLGGGINFTMIGLFKLSKKFSDYGEKFVDKNNFRELFIFYLYKGAHGLWSGNWDDIPDYDESLSDQNLSVGQFWEVAGYNYGQGLLKILQGEFKKVDQKREKLLELIDSYDYEIARELYFHLETMLSLQCGKLNDAQKWVEKWDLYSIRRDQGLMRLHCLGAKTKIQILLEDLAGAEKSLLLADDFIRNQTFVPPVFASTYTIAKLVFDVRLLGDSILSNDKSSISKYRNNAIKNGKLAIKNAKKVAYFRSEVPKLMGHYYWLIGKQNKAVNWWKRAIEEGESLRARPDLARTYMEIGKRFLEKKSKYKDLNGISAERYLQKARVMFEEMDLQWDLDELDKITSNV